MGKRKAMFVGDQSANSTTDFSDKNHKGSQARARGLRHLFANITGKICEHGTTNHAAPVGRICYTIPITKPVASHTSTRSQYSIERGNRAN